jgi:hypothetical protein
MPGFTDKIKKDRLLVELERTNGTMTYGYLLVIRNTPLTDLFDDDRQFLQFQHMSGRETLISKASIAEAMDIVNVTALEYGNGAYNSLGVSRDDNFELISEVYRELVGRCNPELYNGEHYPEELRARLVTVMQHIQVHYNKIRKDKDPTYEAAPR